MANARAMCQKKIPAGHGAATTPGIGARCVRVQSWKGMAFEVQASIDLKQWSPVSTVTNLTGTLEFTDPDVANESRRFYRALLT